MRCISLTQPWATLIALLAKLFETRSWPTNYRGSLGIHAAAGLGPVGGLDGLADLIKREPFKSALGDLIRDVKPGWITTERLPRGAIVAVCELTDCLSTTGRRNEQGTGPKYADWVHGLSSQERAFGDYTPGRFAYRLENIRPLPTSIPARGALGLWTPPPAVLAQITAALGVASC